MPKKRLLMPLEILQFALLMRKAFRQVIELRASNALAEWIQFPKVPSILSESIVVHLINQNKLIEVSNPQARLGGAFADILFSADNSVAKTAEIKASAQAGFSEFVKKDIAADYLIWVHFGETFLNDSEPSVEVNVIESPNQFFKARKITLGTFKTITGNSLHSINLNLASLVSDRNQTVGTESKINQ